MTAVIQVLVDADNVPPSRVLPLLDALIDHDVRMVVAGHPAALERVTWPDDAQVVEAAGWQRADVALADAYQPNADPLVLVSGDSDFALLVANHDGPVLVVSEAASWRLRAGVAVVDPVHDGPQLLTDWLRAVG